MKTVILITCYNLERWIGECVESALNQTRPADEIIVYDDGSNDDSVSILRSYRKHITLIEGRHDNNKTGHQSQDAGILTALRASSGDHIHLLDGDDIYLPNRLEQYEALWESQVDAAMIHAPLKFCDEQGASLPSDGYIAIPPEQHLDWIYRHQRIAGFFATSALAFQRSFLEQQLPLDYSDGLLFAIDIRLSITALLTRKILLLEHPQTQYRIITNSQSSRVRDMSRAAVSRLNCAGFNLYADQYHYPRINYWRDPHYYRQRLRELAPKALGDFFANLITKRSSRS